VMRLFPLAQCEIRGVNSGFLSAMSQFEISALNPAPSLMQAKCGSYKKGLMSFKFAASERNRLP